MGWWKQIWKTKADDWVFGWLEPQQVPLGAQSGVVQPGRSYLNIFLKSARLVDVRRGLTRFYGAVHSFMKVPHQSGKTAEFQVVTTPSELMNLDSRNLDRVIQINQRLLGPVPYAGGDLEIEAGLFSVAGSDLAAPYLSLLEGLSKAAGVSFVSSALPFAGPILEGVKLLTGGNGHADLEVGLSIREPAMRCGYCVVMRAAKGAINLRSLHLDPEDFRVVDADGRTVKDYPYMVLQIDAEPKRDDWFRIPELTESYARIQELYRENSPETNAAIEVFRRIAMTCNDLTTDDATRLAKKVRSLYKEDDSTRSAYTTGDRKPPELKEANLYS
jgi:hypothetical protein